MEEKASSSSSNSYFHYQGISTLLIHDRTRNNVHGAFTPLPPPPPQNPLPDDPAPTTTSGVTHLSLPGDSSRLFGIMTSAEGPSLFRKLLSRSSQQVLLSIGRTVTSDRTSFLALATHPTGSITVLSLLQSSVEVDNLIFSAVCDNFFDLMISKHGHNMIIPTLRAVDRSKKEILYAMAVDYTLNLATQEIGCVALNEFLQEMRGVHRNRFFEVVAMNATWLAQDPHGNFVVQHVLTLENPSATGRIATKLKGSFGRLSVQRLGSYVVEKCLRSPYGREQVLEELRERSDQWIRVAKDQYGNFVAQSTLKILKEMKSPLYEELVNMLKPHFQEMNLGYGRRTLDTIAKLGVP
ncbi:PREDICTED: putative pumilio homolog 21 [Tarenaya hassleriana]|uniref:putative pumilio homolog 21 n=1 Tax=Tarenaya hassleriana TaxID=28532 RepID=UPI00053C5A69|nr:PREDICTED: putative pumilio homolog 21 [Tarenaya hassleriana]